MRKWFSTATIALLTTTAMAQQDVDGSFARLDRDVRAKASHIIDMNLPDGPSSRLRRLTYKSGLICGLINTKNSNGAYLGYRLFAVNLNAENLYLARRETGSTAIERRIFELENKALALSCEAVDGPIRVTGRR